MFSELWDGLVFVVSESVVGDPHETTNSISAWMINDFTTVAMGVWGMDAINPPKRLLIFI